MNQESVSSADDLKKELEAYVVGDLFDDDAFGIHNPYSAKLTELEAEQHRQEAMTKLLEALEGLK